MGRMDLHDLKTGRQRPNGRSPKTFDDGLDVLKGRFLRRAQLRGEGQAAGTDFTRHAGFAPRVRDLDPWRCALLGDKAGDANKRLGLSIVPQAPGHVR